jgi:hypothetical protein
MKEVVKSFYNDVVKRIEYWLPILFFTVTAYGFSIFNRTISGDDLRRDFYLGNGKVMLSGRWGMVLWAKVLGLIDFSPFIDRFVAASFLILAAITISCIFYYLNIEKIKIINYTVLSSVIITYPLINEIWEFGGANFVVTGNILIVSFVLLYLITKEKNNFIDFIISGSILSIVASSYESGIFVYITLVLEILYYKYCVLDKIKKSNWFIEGFYYVIPIAISIFIRVVIGFVIRFIFNLKYNPGGNTILYWGKISLKNLLISLTNFYCLRGLIYLPITVFVIVLLLFIIYSLTITIKRKNYLSIILGLFLIVSLFMQTIIQFYVMPYRTAQTLTVFSAFVIFVIVNYINRINKKYLNIIIYVICFMLCWYQSTCLNKILSLNNQRSDNEAFIIQQIGFKLKSQYNGKPVVFVGEYNKSKWIDSRITADSNTLGGKIYLKIYNKFKIKNENGIKYIDSNVNSNIDWSIPKSNYPFDILYCMQNLFSYYGFDINVIGNNQLDIINQANKIAIEKKMKEYEILEQDNYIIVRF